MYTYKYINMYVLKSFDISVKKEKIKLLYNSNSIINQLHTYICKCSALETVWKRKRLSYFIIANPSLIVLHWLI